MAHQDLQDKVQFLQMTYKALQGALPLAPCSAAPPTTLPRSLPKVPYTQSQADLSPSAQRMGQALS